MRKEIFPVVGALLAGMTGSAVFAQAPPLASAGPAPSSSSQAPADAVVDTAELIALARGAETAKVDQFSADPADAFFGRPFSARPAGPVTVSYDLASHTLNVSTPRWGDLGWVLVGPDPKTVSTYSGQNGYGAKTDVAVMQAEQVLLAGQRVRENMDEVPQPNAVTFTSVLEPDAARALSRNLAWLVMGRLVKRRPASPATGPSAVVLVDRATAKASVSSPTEIHLTTSTLNAVVARVVLVDTTSNKVLLTYDPPLN